MFDMLLHVLTCYQGTLPGKKSARILRVVVGGHHFYYFTLASSILFLRKCQNTALLLLKVLKSKF